MSADAAGVLQQRLCIEELFNYENRRAYQKWKTLVFSIHF